jgi:hypothetical protein
MLLIYLQHCWYRCLAAALLIWLGFLVSLSLSSLVSLVSFVSSRLSASSSLPHCLVTLISQDMTFYRLSHKPPLVIYLTFIISAPPVVTLLVSQMSHDVWLSASALQSCGTPASLVSRLSHLSSLAVISAPCLRHS